MARFTKRGFFGGERVFEVDLDGAEVVTREGRPGGLREQRRRVAPARARAAHYADLCRERLRDGWAQVDPPPVPVRVENAQLEAQASASREAALVFADFLHERGDPWGELIALATARGDDEDALTGRELDLQVAVLPRFLSDPSVLARARASVTWRGGFPWELAVGDDPEPAALEALDRSRLLAEVEAVRLGVNTQDFPASSADQLAWLTGSPRPGVRELYLGDCEHQISWCEQDLLAPFPALPALERLRVRGALEQVEPLRLPGLTHFTLESGGLSAATLAAVAAAPWPRLTHLELWFGDQHYGLTCGAQDVVERLTELRAPGLTHLGLRNCPFAHELVPWLAGSALVKQLRVLDLSMGALQPDDVPALLAHRDGFAHLERLDLSDNMLGGDVGKRSRDAYEQELPVTHLGLDALGPRVVVGKQRSWDEIDGARFSSVGE